MLIANNFIDYKNNIGLTVSPSLQLESIVTTINGVIKSEYIKLSFYDFEEACKKYKELEKQITNK